MSYLFVVRCSSELVFSVLLKICVTNNCHESSRPSKLTPKVSLCEEDTEKCATRGECGTCGNVKLISCCWFANLVVVIDLLLMVVAVGGRSWILSWLVLFVGVVSAGVISYWCGKENIIRYGRLDINGCGDQEDIVTYGGQDIIRYGGQDIIRCGGQDINRCGGRRSFEKIVVGCC